MASLNAVHLLGNLTRDVELRFISDGNPVANFSIAINRSYKTKSGEKKEDVTFVKIVVWGRRAEVCNEWLRKGSPVLIEGRLQTRSWETQTGEKRSVLEVVANNVQFLPTKGPQQSETAPQAQVQPEVDDINGEDQPPF